MKNAALITNKYILFITISINIKNKSAKLEVLNTWRQTSLADEN